MMRTKFASFAPVNRQKAFALALLAGACLASVASAQTTPGAPAASADAMDEVVVTAFRKSLATALDTKRKDIRVSDGISSEDIGKFPSENIAEAIQRIPGVQISNINGRGSTISIRGLGPQYAMTTINGQSFKSANFTDGFRYDVIQTELASAIQVIKSPTADMDAGGLAGTVNIDTVHPFDVRGRQLILAGKLQQQKLAGGDPTGKVGATYVDHFFDDKLGVFLGAGYQALKDRGDYMWMDRWTVNSGVYTPARLRFRRIDRDTKRSMVNGAIQFKPIDTLQIDMIATYAKDKTTQDLHQQVFLFTSPSASNVVTLASANNTATNVQINNFRLENNHQFEARPQSTGAFTTDFHWTGLENWDFKGVAHYSRGHAIFNEEAAILGVIVPSATLDISNPKNIAFATSNSLTDATQYAPANLFRNNYPTGAYRTIDSYEDAAQLDVKRYVDYGFLESIAFGGKYRKEVLKRNVNRFDRQDTNVPTAFAPSLATTGIAVSNFLDGDMTIPGAWISPNIQAYREALAKEGYTVYEAFDPQGSYHVNRDLTSFYAMANLKGEIFSLPFRGNVGVRREGTDQTVPWLRRRRRQPAEHGGQAGRRDLFDAQVLRQHPAFGQFQRGSDRQPAAALRRRQGAGPTDHRLQQPVGHDGDHQHRQHRQAGQHHRPGPRLAEPADRQPDRCRPGMVLRRGQRVERRLLHQEGQERHLHHRDLPDHLRRRQPVEGRQRRLRLRRGRHLLDHRDPERRARSDDQGL
jgi:TonB-dependent receptor